MSSYDSDNKGEMAACVPAAELARYMPAMVGAGWGKIAGVPWQ